MEHVGALDIAIEDTLVTTHCREAFERHGIDEAYADGLLSQCDNWKRVRERSGLSGERLTCVTKRHGVFWKLVLERNLVAQMPQTYDFLTVYPRYVNMGEALAHPRWGEEHVGYLAFYADRNS